MLGTQAAIMAAGLVLGAIIGRLKSGSGLLGAILGVAVASAIVFFMGHLPGRVMAVETIGDFEAKVLQARRPVLVDFHADWCPPCRLLAPTIDTLAREYSRRVDVVRINVDTAAGVASRCGIQSIPTVMLFMNGRPAGQWVGSRPVEQYRAILDSAVKGQVPAMTP